MAEPRLNRRYRCLERIGGGGEGEVFLVEDGPRGPRRVLKALRRLEAGAALKLAGEFRRLAGLDHPAIVRVHDLEVAEAGGFLPEGTAFFTADHVDGAPADQALASLAGADRAAAVWRVAVEISAGLAHLHAAGLRHRDVKPANVLVRRDGAAVLIDLGLAVARGESGSPAGTPGYVAPEELLGAGQAASDLYGLGATLFELCAGRPRFLAPPGLGSEAAAGEILRAALGGSAPALGPLAPGIPPALVRLIEELLAADASARPSSARVVLDRLEVIRESAGYAPVPLAAVAAGLAAPAFVGRVDALAALTARLDALAHGPGGGGVLRLVGPAGVGKSRLLDEALRRWQLEAAIGRKVVIERLGPSLDVIEARLARTTGGEDGLGGGSRAVRWPERGAAEGPLIGLAAALVATSRPRVVHLADGATPEATALVRRLAGATAAPVLVVVEHRVEDPLDPTDAIAVAPLTDEAIHVLAASMLGRAPRIAWTDALAAAAGGLPGTAVLALRVAAARRGADAVETCVPAELTAAAGPAALAELLATHGDEARAVAAALAVAGRAPLAELVAIAALPPVVVAAQVGVLVAAGLAAWAGDDATPASSTHATAALLGVSAAAQRALHVRALAAGGAVDPVRRARHLVVLGPPAAAGEAALAAAAHARLAGRPDAALEWLEVAATRLRGAARTQAELARAELALGIARYDVALAASIAAVGPTSPALIARRAARTRGRALARRGETAAALALGRELLAGSPVGTPEAEELAGFVGRLLVLAGEPAEAAVLIGRPDDELAPARAQVAGRGARLEAAALIAFYGGDGPRAEALAAHLAALARAYEDPALEARGLGLWGLVRQRAGDPGGAALNFAAAIVAARRAGDPHLVATGALGLAGARLDQGDPSAVLDATRDALLELGALGRPRELASALVNRAVALVAFGEVDAARRALDAATLHAADPPQPRVATWIALVEADLARRQGAPARALEAATRAVGLAATQGAHAALAHAACAELQAELGDATGAQASLSAAAAAAAGDDELDRVALATARAAAHGIGDPVAARVRVAATAARLTATGRLGLAWRAEALAGRLAVAARDHVSAAGGFARARAVLDGLLALAPEARRPGLAADPEARMLLTQDPFAAPSAAAPAPSRPPPSSFLNPGAFASPPHAGPAAPPDARLRRVLLLAKRLNGEHRLDRLLDDVIDAMIELTLAERGFLLLGPPGKLTVRVARNIDQRALEGDELRLSRSIAERAAAEGEPVVTIDAATDARFGTAASVSALRLRSVLAVPLRANGRPIGCVYVDHRLRRDVFSDDDVALVLDLADLAAIALENARLAEESAGRAAEVDALAARLETQLAEKALELGAARAALGHEGPALRHRYDRLIGRSPRMVELLRLCDRASDSALPVFIHGESGTGKELVARALHEHGPRGAKAFVPLNCGAVPDALLEAELFGHERGAFTGAERERRGLFEVADGGTLFLDEVGDTSPAMQVKLLRALQSGEIRRVGGDRARIVDVRVITASHQDLGELVRAGRFREDLFYRLHVIRVDVPALRERVDDIPALAAHVLERHGTRHGRAVPRLAREALARLVAYPWPGNVRELENELSRAAALGGALIGLADLSPAIAAADPQAPPLAEGDLSLRPRVERLERSLVAEALARARGNQTAAARSLGLSRFGLQKKLRRFGL